MHLLSLLRPSVHNLNKSHTLMSFWISKRFLKWMELWWKVWNLFCNFKCIDTKTRVITWWSWKVAKIRDPKFKFCDRNIQRLIRFWRVKTIYENGLLLQIFIFLAMATDYNVNSDVITFCNVRFGTHIFHSKCQTSYVWIKRLSYHTWVYRIIVFMLTSDQIKVEYENELLEHIKRNVLIDIKQRIWVVLCSNFRLLRLLPNRQYCRFVCPYHLSSLLSLMHH